MKANDNKSVVNKSVNAFSLMKALKELKETRTTICGQIKYIFVSADETGHDELKHILKGLDKNALCANAATIYDECEIGKKVTKTYKSGAKKGEEYQREIKVSTSIVLKWIISNHEKAAEMTKEFKANKKGSKKA